MTDSLERKDVVGSSYKNVVDRIKNLRWENLDGSSLQELMYISYVAAREFAESLRIALELYPDDEQLKVMAKGELQTNNLVFGGINITGDHADFLAQVKSEIGFVPRADLLEKTDRYLEVCRSLSRYARAMSVFSREEELSSIFERVLKAKDWSAPGLDAFRYYLETHIKLDSSKGGHHDLLSHFQIDDSVRPFYEARLEMYKAIPKLFQ